MSPSIVPHSNKKFKEKTTIPHVSLASRARLVSLLSNVVPSYPCTKQDTTTHVSKVTLGACPNRQSSHLQEVQKLTSPALKRKRKPPTHKAPPVTPSPACSAQPGSGWVPFHGCAAFVLLNLPQGQTLPEWTDMNHPFRPLSHSGLSASSTAAISVRLSCALHHRRLLNQHILLFQLPSKASGTE